MYALSSTESSSTASQSSRSASSAFRSALTKLYVTRRDALFTFAARSLVSHSDADDAVQDAFLQVLESPPRDVSEHSLGEALDGALRVACGLRAQQRASDERLAAGIRRRRRL